MTKKREEFSKSHTTILRDEYKTEDMMVIVWEAWLKVSNYAYGFVETNKIS